MLPTKSNTADQGCSPVSSNCVVWQGPNLSCINLCNGDTVSDVVYKLAVELCAFQGDLGLSDLDLTCLVQVCQATPMPERTLAAVLDLLINKVCCLADIVDNLPTGSTPYVEPTLNLPACLQYQNAQGQTVTSLVHSQYSLTLAQKICQLNTTVNTHTTQIGNHETRITVLENAPAATLPTVTPNCLLTPGTPAQMNVLLDELEAQYCLLRNVLGTNTAITAAAAQQCANLGAQNALSQAGTLSSIAGWNATITNLAQSFQNLWITVCDMRAAINDVKNCCNTVDCSQFILRYAASTNALRQEVYLDFNPGTIIPAGFSNCSQLGSLVTISDGTVTKDFYVDLVSLSSSTSVFTAVVAGSSVVGAALNTSLPYTITVNGCISKDGKSCEKAVVNVVTVPCPIVTGVTATLV